MLEPLMELRTDLLGVDWEALRLDLIADDFHNGRTTEQLRVSFENSYAVAMGFVGGRCLANGRLLSDGIGNAYVVDVWTHSTFRLRGIGHSVMRMLLATVPGQHVYLQTDDALEFYSGLGFREQPVGLSVVVGEYLRC